MERAAFVQWAKWKEEMLVTRGAHEPISYKSFASSEWALPPPIWSSRKSWRAEASEPPRVWRCIFYAMAQAYAILSSILVTTGCWPDIAIYTSSCRQPQIRN